MSGDTSPARPERFKASRLKLKSGVKASGSASQSCSQSSNLLKYETDTVPDWNPEFLNACVTQEAHFSL